MSPDAGDTLELEIEIRGFRLHARYPEQLSPSLHEFIEAYRRGPWWEVFCCDALAALVMMEPWLTVRGAVVTLDVTEHGWRRPAALLALTLLRFAYQHVPLSEFLMRVR
jgi:hypothetical protein